MHNEPTQQAVMNRPSKSLLNFKSVRNSVKTVTVVVLLSSAILSAMTFFDTLGARNIISFSDENYWDMGQNLNINSASTNELEAIAARALTVQPRHLILAESANNLLLKKMDKCLNCETRIVLLDEFQSGSLSKPGLAALSRTYEYSPYGSVEFMQWRLEISNRHWNLLDSNQQKGALSQITAIAQQPDGRKWLLDFVTNQEEISERIDRFRAPDPAN